MSKISGRGKPQEFLPTEITATLGITALMRFSVNPFVASMMRYFDIVQPFDFASGLINLSETSGGISPVKNPENFLKLSL